MKTSTTNRIQTFFSNPNINSVGEIYYGDERPADWDEVNTGKHANWDTAKSIATEIGDTDSDASDLEVHTSDITTLSATVGTVKIDIAREQDTEIDNDTLKNVQEGDDPMDKLEESYPSINWVINALEIAQEQATEILEGTNKIHQSKTDST